MLLRYGVVSTHIGPVYFKRWYVATPGSGEQLSYEVTSCCLVEMYITSKEELDYLYEGTNCYFVGVSIFTLRGHNLSPRMKSIRRYSDEESVRAYVLGAPSGLWSLRSPSPSAPYFGQSVGLSNMPPPNVLKSYQGRKIYDTARPERHANCQQRVGVSPRMKGWRIMDLNQYIGSMNAKDCIYQNPKWTGFTSTRQQIVTSCGGVSLLASRVATTLLYFTNHLQLLFIDIEITINYY